MHLENFEEIQLETFEEIHLENFEEIHLEIFAEFHLENFEEIHVPKSTKKYKKVPKSTESQFLEILRDEKPPKLKHPVGHSTVN